MRTTPALCVIVSFTGDVNGPSIAMRLNLILNLNTEGDFLNGLKSARKKELPTLSSQRMRPAPLVVQVVKVCV